MFGVIIRGEVEGRVRLAPLDMAKLFMMAALIWSGGRKLMGFLLKKDMEFLPPAPIMALAAAS
jgi:hypothetical protein